MDLKNVETALTDINNIVSKIDPLVGVIGGLASLVIETARKARVDTTSFEEDMAKWEPNRAGLKSAIDEFRAKYPQAAPAPPTPPTPSSGSSGD